MVTREKEHKEERNERLEEDIQGHHHKSERAPIYRENESDEARRLRHEHDSIRYKDVIGTKPVKRMMNRGRKLCLKLSVFDV